MNVRFTRKADRDIADFERHYKRLDRPEAIDNMRAAVDSAVDRIATDKARFLSAPRPYPSLANLGLLWTLSGRYWLSILVEVDVAVITGVFFDEADIPGRIKPDAL